MTRVSTRLCLIGAVAALLTVLASPGSALASTSSASPTGARVGPPSGVPCSVGSAGVACFAAKGDVLWIRDKKEDGYHVDAPWTINGWKKGTCHNRHGKKAGWTYCKLANKVPEHKNFGFRAVTTRANETPVGNGTSGPEVIARST